MRSGHAGFGFFIPWQINSLMLKCQKIVTKTLMQGKLSAESIFAAIETIKEFGAKIEKLVERSWSNKPDTKDPTLTVDSYAKASGDGDKELQTHTTVAMMQADDYATLAIGTAESYAATNGGETYVNTISGMKGGDTGTKHTYYEKGANYEKATEVFVGIDWHAVYDREWTFSRQHNFHSRKKAEIKDGVKVVASNDAYIEVDNYADVEQSNVANFLENSVSSYSGQAVQVG